MSRIVGRVGLELVVAARTVVGTGLAVAARDGLAGQRDEGTQHDFLASGRHESGVDELDAVDLSGREQLDDVLADPAGVVVARLVAETR